jgi:hypothetical protein
MKNNILLLAFVSSFVVAGAQQPLKGHEKIFKSSRPDAEIIKSIFQKQLANNSSQLKTTGTQKRLKANSYITNGNLQDSNRYVYSGDRGSMHPVNESYYISYSPTGVDPKLYIYCDTAYSYHDYQGQGNLDESSSTFIYDSKNNVTDYATAFMTYVYGYITTYNSKNLPETVTIFDRSGSTPKATSKIYIFYDSQNQRIMDSTQNLLTNMPGNKRVYTYDANGNRTSFLTYSMQTGTPVLTYRTTYTYDNNKRLTSNISEGDIGSGFQYFSKDSFAYTGTNTQYSLFENFSWDANTGDWAPQDLQIFNVNSSNLIDDYIIYEWTGTQWDTTEKDFYVYSNNLLQKVTGHLYSGNGSFNPIPYDQTTYYYEDYFLTGIDKVNDTEDVIFYPNPAKETLFINTANIINGIAIIYNMAGQSMMQQKLQNNKINISSLPAGNYIINIQDNKQQRVYQKQFSKQ